ncbi:unnamed protein product, partial [Amoebophrya sp. A25]
GKGNATSSSASACCPGWLATVCCGADCVSPPDKKDFFGTEYSTVAAGVRGINVGALLGLGHSHDKSFATATVVPNSRASNSKVPSAAAASSASSASLLTPQGPRLKTFPNADAASQLDYIPSLLSSIPDR